MPELPEVEGARRLAERTCVGKTITEASVADDEKVINDIAPKELEKVLVGRTLLAARRRGKQMWWEFDSGPSLLLHFGMTGGLVVKGVGAAHYKNFVIDDTAWPPKYCKIELTFADGTQLAFCDSRRFAKVRFLEHPESVPPISELGWDPILDMPTLQAFTAQLLGQRRAIKALLLDQSFSAGIGNWVADEVLYQARIHPEQPANSIPSEQLAELHHAIKHVCEVACEVEADAHRFPTDWLFHYRWGKGSSSKAKVAGHTIDHITVGGRTSAYVPALQKLSKAAVAAAVGAGKKAAGAAGEIAAAGARGSGSKKAADAVVATEEVAAAAADVAVAVAQVAAKPRANRKAKAAVAHLAAATAAEVVEAAAAAEAGSGADGKQKAQRGGRRKKGAVGDMAASTAQDDDVGGAHDDAVAGAGSKRFRGGRRAAADAAAATDEAPSAPAGSASGRKRKTPAAAAEDGAAEEVTGKGRHGRAGRSHGA